MASSLTPHAVAALLACLVCPAVTAGTWQADQHSGTLHFIATQAGARFQGQFGEFAVRLEFDPAEPAKAQLDVTIEMQSANTADADRDEVLHGRDFFRIVNFPRAEYHAVGFTRDGKGWIISGELTLRDATRPVTVRFELEPSSRELHMKGDSTVHRLEFGVGQGEWASTTWIGDPVDIAFDLKLRPLASAASP
ncbi:MAG: YceI family protein [Gammaproteobacteria bacterium]|nr:YceI family protein [Gammaproteobacteria bacterium]